MKYKIHLKSVFSLCIGILVYTEAHAVDLVEVYKLAEASDPQYREVIAAYRATLESKPQAWSQLYPSVNLNANTFSNDQDISVGGNAFGRSGDIGFNTHGYVLDIRQPLFRYDRYLTLKQADSLILQAQATVDEAHQDLIVRLAERYFNVLAAIDNIVFARAEKKSLERQLEQAKQRFDVGLTAITDVQEARAGYDRATADEILAINLLDNTREALREIIGEYVQDFSPLGNNMQLVTPEPNSIESWTEIAIEQNLGIIAARYNLETAQQEIKIQQSGHLPSLDIVANHGFNSSGGRFGGIQTHSDAIGLELSVPLYEGGLVNSRTREARYRYDQALEQLEQQHRSAQRQTREAFLGVISGISRVNALKQALVSTETALDATVAGFEVGTRTAVDVVASERATLQAKRDYARSRYDYILNTLRLKKAAGTLSPDDLEKINYWLD